MTSWINDFPATLSLHTRIHIYIWVGIACIAVILVILVAVLSRPFSGLLPIILGIFIFMETFLS